MTTVAVVLSSTVTAQADPGISEVGYTARAVGNSASVTIDAGSMDIADGQLEIRDDDGRLMVALPLVYYRDDRIWPIAAVTDGATATLTPSVDPASAVSAPGTSPQLNEIALDPMSLAAALSTFGTVLSIGIALGTIIGTLVGAALGCVIGGALAGGAAAIPSFGTLAIPGFLGGCIITAIAGATLGAIVGTIVFGVPAIIIGAVLLVIMLSA
ncbi:hypothetical protein [Nocardia sp. NPDC051570]|uniref:hypothetical protein n=1 Tax=Nocardia sp. NPDC051570 TaxID=3364324 RepID=UPI0037AA0FC7